MTPELHEWSHELPTFKLDRNLLHKSVGCMLWLERLNKKTKYLLLVVRVGLYIAALAFNHPPLSERQTANHT